MSFQNILLALDRTEKADRVFEQGIEIAQKYNACITLAHCAANTDVMAASAAVAPAGVGMPLPTSVHGATSPATMADSAPGSVADTQLNQQMQVAREWLRHYQQKAYDAGSEEALPAIRFGEPGQCICDLAAEIGADLIIVGRKDRSGIEELLLGSVSSSIVHHAPCAVLVVQTE